MTTLAFALTLPFVFALPFAFFLALPFVSAFSLPFDFLLAFRFFFLAPVPLLSPPAGPSEPSASRVSLSSDLNSAATACHLNGPNLSLGCELKSY
jgi:hypothetical protein